MRKHAQFQFPFPPEVTGVSYKYYSNDDITIDHVSVPSRGDWGFLLNKELTYHTEIPEFPYPLEVTGVSYRSNWNKNHQK